MELQKCAGTRTESRISKTSFCEFFSMPAAGETRVCGMVGYILKFVAQDQEEHDRYTGSVHPSDRRCGVAAESVRGYGAVRNQFDKKGGAGWPLGVVAEAGGNQWYG